jgi:hypothetical protein
MKLPFTEDANKNRQIAGIGELGEGVLESPTVAELARQIGSLLSVGQTTEQSVKEEREEIEI